MHTEHTTPSEFHTEKQRSLRLTPETKVTLDLSGIPSKAQQAISAWLSEKDQQAIVNALAAMARRVDEEMQLPDADGTVRQSDGTSEILVIPSLKSASFRLFNQTEITRDAA
jgi:hypothetical protein